MKYLPELFCSEVKPGSVYLKNDYISLLVKASTPNIATWKELETYPESDDVTIRKGSRKKFPTGETALSYFKTIDQFELKSVIGIVIEDQVAELEEYRIA
jgi:hypothetical protein